MPFSASGVLGLSIGIARMPGRDLFIYVYVLVYVYHVCVGALQRSEESLDGIKLELQVIMSCLI